jgi:hypothetical protein
LRRNLVVSQPGSVDRLDPLHPAHPGQLAPGVLAVRGLDRLEITGQELLEAERRAGGARGAGGVGGARLLPRS